MKLSSQEGATFLYNKLLLKMSPMATRYATVPRKNLASAKIAKI